VVGKLLFLFSKCDTVVGPVPPEIFESRSKVAQYFAQWSKLKRNRVEEFFSFV